MVLIRSNLEKPYLFTVVVIRASGGRILSRHLPGLPRSIIRVQTNLKRIPAVIAAGIVASKSHHRGHLILRTEIDGVLSTVGETASCRPHSSPSFLIIINRASHGTVLEALGRSNLGAIRKIECRYAGNIVRAGRTAPSESPGLVRNHSRLKRFEFSQVKTGVPRTFFNINKTRKNALRLRSHSKGNGHYAQNKDGEMIHWIFLS